jgi:hypothetical protein
LNDHIFTIDAQWSERWPYRGKLGPLGIKLLLPGLDSGSLSKGGHLPGSAEVGVQLEHSSHVLERVLPLLPALHLLVEWLNHRLHLVRVDNPAQVSVGHLGPRQNKALLLLRRRVKAPIHLLELLERALGPDHKAPEVSTGGEVEQVEALDVGDVHAGEVAEGLDDLGALGAVDDERALAVDVAAVAHLTLAGADADGVLGLLGVGVGADLLEDLERLGGLLDGLRRVRDDQGHLWDGLDAVAARLDEGRDGGGGERRGDGDAAEVDVDAAVPLAPDLGGREHASAAAHVAECSLAGAVGAAAGDAGDTGHSAARTPGLGRRLVASAAGDCVRLALVAGQQLVGEADHVRADRRTEDGRQGDAGGVRDHVALQGLHGDERAAGGGHGGGGCDLGGAAVVRMEA